MDPMETIRQTFFQECEEQLNETETGLLALEIGEADSETVNAVFRAVHSIKGGAGAFKYERLVRFAHVFETALDGLRNGRLEASPSAMKTMLRSADLLADLVREARGDAAVDDARLEALRDELGRLAEEPGEPATQAADSFGFQPLTLSLDDLAPETPPSQGWRIVFRPAPDLYRRGNEPARILRELAELGDMRVTCDASALPLLDAFDPGGAYLAWSIDLTSAAPREKVEDAFDFVIDDCELRVAPLAPALNAEAANADGLEFTPLSIDLPMIDAPTAPQAAASPPPTERKVETVRTEATVSQTIRVDLERVDRLANLVGELVINQAMLSQSIVEAGLASRLKSLRRPDRAGAAHARDPGRDHGDPRAAGETVVPAHDPHRARGRGRHGQDGAAEDRRRGDRSGSHRVRKTRGPVDPPDPQRGRSRAGDAGRARRRRQAGTWRSPAYRRASLGPHRHRRQRRRQGH